MLAKFLLKNIFLLLSIAISISFKSNNNISIKNNKILIFSKTNGYRHESIASGIEAIKKLGLNNNFSVDATEDSTFFTDDNLKKYQEIVFLSTTGTILGKEQEIAFQNFIHNGGGFVGIHAASDCEFEWPWFVKLVGGNFESHPKPQQAKLIVVNKKHPATKHLPNIWQRTDEWYNFKNLNPAVTVLLKIDETSYTGGKNGDNHPMAWCHTYEGGKVFYTELGHTKESFSESLFLKHILGGIQYSMGK